MSGSLPANWARASIGSLCELKNGRAFKPSEWCNQGLPIVRIQNLNNAGAQFNHFDGEYDAKHFLAGGELLFAWSGTPGTSFGAHIWRGGNALLNQHIFRVDIDERLLDKRFFRHAINQKLTELINVAHGGAGLQHVTKGIFESTEVTVPPREEQQRISDKLDTVLARVDAVNDRLGRVAPLLKRFRQAVLAAATSGRLTADWREGAEPNWQTLPAEEACEKVQSGGTPKAGFALEGIPFLKVYNIVDQRLDFDYRPQFVSPDVHASELKKSRVLPGDVLMNIVGPPLCKVAVVPADHTQWNINQAITLFRPSSKVSSSWLYIVLCEGQQVRDVLKDTKGSVGQVNISLSQCRSFRIPIPGKEEQSEIVRRVNVLFDFADRLEARLQTAQTAASRLTPSLLAKAFRGELVQQDPNDEPASVLLQRLSATPSAKAQSTRGRPRTQPVVPIASPAPLAPVPIDWRVLPNNEWAAPAASQDQAFTVCLIAVLRAWGQPMPEMEARLATLLCKQPRVFTTLLPAAQAKHWGRLVGDEAKPFPAQVTPLQPASNTPWGQAIKRMRARGDLVETGDGDDTTWSLGPSASIITTAGWPDGRASFVVAHLRAHGVESILPALEPADQAFVHVRAA